MYNNNLRPPRRKKEIQSLDFLILLYLQNIKLAKFGILIRIMILNIGGKKAHTQ